MKTRVLHGFFIVVVFIFCVRCEEEDDLEGLLRKLKSKLTSKQETADGVQGRGNDAEMKEKALRGLLLEGIHALTETEKRDHVTPFSVDWNQYDCDDDYVALRRTVNMLFRKYCRKIEPPSINVDNKCATARQTCADTESCCSGLTCIHWVCKEDSFGGSSIWHKGF